MTLWFKYSIVSLPNIVSFYVQTHLYIHKIAWVYMDPGHTEKVHLLINTMCL